VLAVPGDLGRVGADVFAAFWQSLAMTRRVILEEAPGTTDPEAFAPLGRARRGSQSDGAQ
jgi:hypothetical protein